VTETGNNGMDPEEADIQVPKPAKQKVPVDLLPL